MATQSHLQAGPSKNEDVHPHRRELLEFSRSFRRKTVPHQIGQHLPRPHGREKMPTTDGGSVECAKNRNRPPANSLELATILQHTPVWEMRKSCITATSDFKCPKAESIGSSNIHVSPTRWNYKVTGTSQAIFRLVQGRAPVIQSGQLSIVIISLSKARPASTTKPPNEGVCTGRRTS